MALIVDTDELRLVKSILRQHLPNTEIRAFGSRVHGDNLKPFSDLDLVVMNDEPLDFLTLATLKEAFTESPLSFKVDILEWSGISPEFRQRIEPQSIVILVGKGGDE